MHPSILEAGTSALAAALPLVLAAALATALPSGAQAGPSSAQPAKRQAAAPVRSACPPARAAVQEVFIAADCTDCWAAAGSGAATAATTWRFDWITPTADSAPLAPAALPEAADRAQRASSGPPAGGQRSTGRAALPHLPGPAGQPLAVVSGPAWQGYFAVQMTLARGVPAQLPAGSSAWLALVERVPAGSEGSAIGRELVRTVAGPLPLPPPPGQPPAAAGAAAASSAAAPPPLTHLRALRWPDTAQPTRLQARAWIEGPDGAVLAVAADRCP